jgi:hypothetical protein
VLTFGIVQFLGIIAWFRLPNLPLPIPVGYLLVRNLIWLGFSMLITVSIIMGKRWAARLTLWGGVAMFLWLALDHLLLARSDYAFKSCVSNLLLFAVGLFIVLWSLNRTSSRKYIEECLDE